MEFNRFDIAVAYYLYFSHYYDGMWSREYERLCKMCRWFRPNPLLTLESLNKDDYIGARYVFINLLERNGENLPEELQNVEV